MEEMEKAGWMEHTEQVRHTEQEPKPEQEPQPDQETQPELEPEQEQARYLERLLQKQVMWGMYYIPGSIGALLLLMFISYQRLEQHCRLDGLLLLVAAGVCLFLVVLVICKNRQLCRRIRCAIEEERRNYGYHEGA